MDYLLPGERFDELQRNGYRIIQNPAKFCLGMDAVLLSGFASFTTRSRSTIHSTGTSSFNRVYKEKEELWLPERFRLRAAWELPARPGL